MKLARLVVAGVLAAGAALVTPMQVLGQPIVCVPPPPDPPCPGQAGCIAISDEWRILVQPTGKLSLGDEAVTRSQLEQLAKAWAKSGTWPIVVRGDAGIMDSQLIAIVALLRKAGVRTRVSCVSTQP